jgi:ketosteroid isomerase-like protein
MGIKDFKLTTHDVVGSEDLLVETGSYEMYGDKNAVIDKGKYVVAWKKENGNWKLYRDIANTSMPMARSK